MTQSEFQELVFVDQLLCYYYSFINSSCNWILDFPFLTYLALEFPSFRNYYLPFLVSFGGDQNAV